MREGRARRCVRFASLAGMTGVLLLAAGCGHKKKAAKAPQTAPPARQPSGSSGSSNTARIPVTELPDGGISDEDKQFVQSHKPIFTEEGAATWYTAPYKGRKAANGELFRDDALTAAHRTLPMGSLIVVTNLTTRQSSAMRISDRGPFVQDRILDLSIASAKAIGIYRVGTAR